MLQNRLTIENRHKRFIKTVCETEVVYALRNNEGYATSSSNYLEEEDGEPIGIICFWAEKARAKSCKKNGWKDYELAEIPLFEFIENWCVGMANEGLLVGTQFDQNMFGYEEEPLNLILDLVTKLKSSKKDLNFRKFGGIADIEKQVKEVMT